MTEKPFSPPGSPEGEGGEYKHPMESKMDAADNPMEPKMKDAREEERQKHEEMKKKAAATEEKRQSLLDKLRERLGMPKKPKKSIEMTDVRTGKKVEAEIIEDEQNGKDQAA